MTSEKLWGVGPSLPACTTYQFLKRDNIAVVSLWLWDGKSNVPDGGLLAHGKREPDKGERELVTSAVTLLEVLVIPYRVGNLALAERYEAVLSRSRGLHMVEIDRDVLRAAAQIRAVYGTRPADAIQLAAATLHRCSAFITNDRRLPDAVIRVIQLEALDE